MFTKPDFRPCNDISFFRFVRSYWKGAIPEKFLKPEHMAEPNSRPFHRLCSLMRKMDAKTVVIEHFEDVNELENDREIIDEIKGLEDFYGRKITIDIHRFTFLAKDTSSVDGLLKLSTKDFLSNAVLINGKGRNEYFSYLLRACSRRPRAPIRIVSEDGKTEEVHRLPLMNNYIHVCRDFASEIKVDNNNTHQFTISGTFFCQKNDRTSVCAQATLKMILNNMPDLEPLVTTGHINSLVTQYRIKEKLPPKKEYEGITRDESKHVLGESGMVCNDFDFFDNPKIDYGEYVHRFIESKCPCILIFSTDSVQDMHVVPVLGHTLNSELWYPEAEGFYRPELAKPFVHASKWVDNFIIHDDNFGMYLCLPIDSLRRMTLPTTDPHFRVYYAMGICPFEINMPGSDAENAAAISLRNVIDKVKRDAGSLRFWVQILDDYIEKRTLVFRSCIVDRDQFGDHFKKNKDSEGKRFSAADIDWMLSDLPMKFWLCEISIPGLYSTNKSKLADAIYGIDDPPISKKEQVHDRLQLLRMPGYAYKPQQEPRELGVKSHYPLVRTAETLEY